MKRLLQRSLFPLVIFTSAGVADAKLIVNMEEPKQAGQKAVLKLTIKNTFKEKVESARATVFVMDEKGKVVGRAAQWVIGGTKDDGPLAPDASTTYNFVVPTQKPFKTAKVSFNRIVLAGGKSVDPAKSFELAK